MKDIQNRYKKFSIQRNLDNRKGSILSMKFELEIGQSTSAIIETRLYICLNVNFERILRGEDLCNRVWSVSRAQ